MIEIQNHIYDKTKLDIYTSKREKHVRLDLIKLTKVLFNFLYLLSDLTYLMYVYVTKHWKVKGHVDCLG